MKSPSNPILIIEDNLDDQLLARRAFEKNSVSNRIVIASDGIEAIELLHDCKSPLNPVFLLMDLKLPKMTGHELLRRIRSDERSRHIPIIVMSSSGEREDIAESYRLGANSYIRKPVDFKEFHAVVGQLCLYWITVNTPCPGKPWASDTLTPFPL